MELKRRPISVSARTAGFPGFSPVGTRDDVYQVLRNTYLLLSATLLFSAAMATVSMSFGVGRMPPLFALIGMFGLLFWVQRARNSVWGLPAIFAFTGFIGFMTGPVINFYLRAFPDGGHIVGLALAGTGAIFLGLSGYALASKRDFSNWGAFLTAGLIIVVIASIANLFFHIAALAVAVSAMAMVVFSGLIMFDTSRIISGGETNYISATLSLYLDVYNIFISLLSLLGFASSSSRN